MSLDKKSLKARLLNKYAEQLDAMLEELSKQERLDISEIENVALNLRQEVAQEVTEALSEEAGQYQEVDVMCPDCKQPMRHKGYRKKWIKSQTGEVQIKRAYYYCPDCQAGHFPPR